VRSDERITVRTGSAYSIAATLRQRLRPAMLAQLVAILTGKAPATAPTCGARSQQTGRRCGRTLPDGAVVCHAHGGAAGQVRAKALARASLAEALANGDRRPAWEILLDSMHTVDVVARQIQDQVVAG